MMERSIYTYRGHTDQFEFIDNQFHGISAKESSKKIVSVLDNQHLGLAQGTLYSDAESLTAEARRLCPFSRKVDYGFPSSGGTSLLPRNAIPQLTDDEIIDFSQGIIERLLKLYPEVTVDVMARRTQAEVHYENSHGVVHEGREVMLTYTFNVQRSNEEDLFSEYHRFDHRVHEDGPSAKELIRYLDEIESHFPIVEMSSGEFPTILLAQNLEPFFTGLWQALDGKRVYENQSILKGKFGSPLFDPRLRLSIDTRVQGIGGFDFEGVDAREIVAVDHGVVPEALYDLDYAKKCGQRPSGLATGNPRSRFQTYPLRMDWGTRPLDTMLKDVNRGIILVECGEMSRTTNLKGDFSCGVDALYFDHGHVLGRVKNLNVSGNLFSILKDGFVEASSEGVNSPVLGIMAPHHLLKGLRFTV